VPTSKPKHRPGPRYSIDTSALIHAWRRAYPPKNFITFWRKLDQYVADGVVLASVEVKAELKKKDDEIHVWFDSCQDSFCVDVDDEQQEHLAYIMGKYPRLVDTVKGRSECDPFVIALARAHSPRLTVISQEGNGKKDSPKIPDVCRAESIECMTLVEFIQAEDWRL
jgi:hypothetical protein